MKLLSRLGCLIFGHYFPFFDDRCIHCGLPRDNTPRTWQKEDGI